MHHTSIAMNFWLFFDWMMVPHGTGRQALSRISEIVPIYYHIQVDRQ